MHHRTITTLASTLLIVTCAIVCGCVAPDDQCVDVNTTVPVENGWTQASVALLELSTMGEAGQEAYDRFNGSVVSPKPLILSDVAGNPLYYRFYVEKNGEPVYAVQVSANKLLGTTVTDIGDFGYIGMNESLNIPVNESKPSGAAPGPSGTAYGTPVPSYGGEYAQLMLDCWDARDAYAQGVARDAENAGIDLSRPISADDRDVIRDILWDRIRLREVRLRAIEEQYRVDL